VTNPFLDLVRERVVVYDGATGTWLQTQHLNGMLRFGRFTNNNGMYCFICNLHWLPV